MNWSGKEASASQVVRISLSTFCSRLSAGYFCYFPGNVPPTEISSNFLFFVDCSSFSLFPDAALNSALWNILEVGSKRVWASVFPVGPSFPLLTIEWRWLHLTQGVPVSSVKFAHTVEVFPLVAMSEDLEIVFYTHIPWHICSPFTATLTA